MVLSDLFIGPIFLAIYYSLAYAIRPAVTNKYTKPYFIPALTVKFVGAIGLGILYQFYYKGGDTYNYFGIVTLIHSAFSHSFSAGWKLLLTSGGEYDPETFAFSSQMLWYFADSPEYLVSRIAAGFSVLSLNSYVAIALSFAVMSFSGLWAMYVTFVKLRPQVYNKLAISTLFVPSVFFWGSGLMKDSLCLGALGWLFYAFYRGGIQRQKVLQMLLIGFAVSYLLLRIKAYILLAFLPAALLWLFNENSARIRNKFIRVAAKPFFIAIGLAVSVFALTNLTKGNNEYDIDKIGARTKLTSDYLYRISVEQKGSAYSLGEQDGSLAGMARLAPQAIVVALFRPFLWEVRNPIMLLSALESLFFLGFTIRILYRSGIVKTLALVSATPILSLCFVYAIIFAATVGIVSNNFGTLVRYKIPMVPFYLGGLYITESISTVVQRTAKTLVPGRARGRGRVAAT